MHVIEIGTQTELIAMVEPNDANGRQVQLYDALLAWIFVEQGGQDFYNAASQFEVMPEFAELRRLLRQRIADGQEIGIIEGLPVNKGNMTPVFHAR